MLYTPKQWRHSAGRETKGCTSRQSFVSDVTSSMEMPRERHFGFVARGEVGVLEHIWREQAYG